MVPVQSVMKQITGWILKLPNQKSVLTQSPLDWFSTFHHFIWTDKERKV